MVQHGLHFSREALATSLLAGWRDFHAVAGADGDAADLFNEA